MTVFASCQRVSFLPLKRRQRLMEFSWKMKVSTALILINFLFPTGECTTCSLPVAWNGKWFIDEFANEHPSTINSSTNSISRFATDVNQKLGNCIWQDRDFYIFQNVEAKCSKCVLISEKHKNVLYSKEAYCQPDKERDLDDPDALCHALEESHDHEQYFWFRVDYKPITCPFVESAFQFSYRKGWGAKCEKPISHSSTCIENTKMELQYEACHDNLNSIGKTEQITCVGGWGDSGYDYLIADVTRMNNHGEQSLRDRYRCFTYQKNTMMSSNPGKPAIVTGYDVGTSDLATCIGLHSPDQAETTLYFKKDLPIDTEEEKPCKFPSWFGEHHWMDMSKSVEFQLSPLSKNRSVQVQPTRHYHDAPKVDISSSKRKTFFPLSHSNLVCLDKMNLTGDSDEQVAIVAKYTVGCKIDTICLHIIKRSEYIFQMYYLEEVGMNKTTLRDKCFNATFSELRRGNTMISTRGVREACPYPGKYLPTQLESQPFKMNSDQHAASDREWLIGCNGAHDVTLLPSPHNAELKHFYCMDSWTEGNSSFTIMSSANDHNQELDKLHCIISDINGDRFPSSSESRQTLVITSQDCLLFSETYTNYEDDVNVNLSNTDETYTDGIELYKTGHCNSTSIEEHATNESAMTPKIDHLLDSHSHSGSGSCALKTMELVYFVTLFMTVLILNFAEL